MINFERGYQAPHRTPRGFVSKYLARCSGDPVKASFDLMCMRQRSWDWIHSEYTFRPNYRNHAKKIGD